MKKQINRYDSPEAYTTGAAGRDANKSAVSQVGTAIVADGINVIVPALDGNCEVGDLLLYDTTTGGYALAKRDTFRENLLPARYIFSGGAYLCHYGDEAVFVSKDSLGNSAWAANTEYKLALDLSAAGGFDWSCNPRGDTFTGSVTWAADADIESIMAQLTNKTNLTFTKINATSIGVSISNSTSAVLTITNNIGVTVTDCATTTRIGVDGVETGTHHSWQGEFVKTCVPQLTDYMTASTASYAVNGYNLPYNCCANFARFKTYWGTYGKAEFATEGTIDPMRQSVWDTLGESENEAAVALYNKYGGDYDAYLAARKWNTLDSRGTNRTCRTAAQGKRYTDALASVYYTSFDGTTKPVYTAAAKVKIHGVNVDGHTTGFEAGNWHMVTNDELCRLIEDNNMAKLNAAFSHCTNKTLLANNKYIWSCGEDSAYGAWDFSGSTGSLRNRFKSDGCQVRPALALKLKS